MCINAEAGDILYGKNNKNIDGISPHFIIYLSDEGSSFDLFKGAMLTSSSGFNNISLQEKHFVKYDEHGTKWQVYYKLSFISSDLYHKKIEWSPFTKVGKLSDEGLKFILDQIGHKKPILFPLNRK